MRKLPLVSFAALALAGCAAADSQTMATPIPTATTPTTGRASARPSATPAATRSATTPPATTTAPTTPTTAPTTPTTPTTPGVALDPATYVGQRATDVEKALKDLGLATSTQDVVTDQVPDGTVVGLSPAGPFVAGDTVTLQVAKAAKGKGNGNSDKGD